MSATAAVFLQQRLLLLLVFLLILLLPPTPTTSCSVSDSHALLAFFARVDNLTSSLGAGWPSSSSSNGSCCDWEGVSCDESSRIVNISVSGRKLQGSLSEGLAAISSLRSLDVSDNKLRGPLPPDLAKLPALSTLDAGGNNLSGELGIALAGGFASLQFLNLTGNSFNGSLGGDDGRALANMTQLRRFLAGSNELGGELPVVQLCRIAPLLEEIDLSSNSFSGAITDSLTSCSALKHLDLNRNAIAGPIPASLAACASLQSLNLAKNHLSGPIPSGLHRLPSLTTLLLSSNELNGSVLALNGSRNLVSVILSKNAFREPIPAAMPGLPADLQLLALGYIGLSGSIPSWLANCTKLQVLDLSWNNLSGPVPPWLSSLPHLFYLDLSNNSLSGSVPPELFSMPAWIKPDTNLSGLQPVVSNLAIKQNSDVPELLYTQVSAFPPSLFLSHNRLAGPVPPQLSACILLLDLDLSFNALSGSIPDEISGMAGLESLDLSHNALLGAIPASLASLTFLSSFDVSYNRLEGPIPTGNQFSTFSNESYEGNPGLCGAPLSRACDEATTAAGSGLGSGSGGNKGTKGRAVTIAAAVIPASVIALGFVALLSCLTWRLGARRSAVHHRSDGSSEAPPSPMASADDDEDRDEPGSGTTVVVLFDDEEDAHDKQRNGGGGEKKLSMAELRRATNGFDPGNVVGCGGFGMVYRADLDDGSRLAVKKLMGECGQAEREFRAEVEALSRARHENLVPLRGYARGQEKLLIYAYMENGSLDYWLHEKPDGRVALDWPRRLRIARGSALALAYLHLACDPHIVHRDVKSSNILLDDAFGARLADFGLARLLLSPDRTHITTDVVGTLGYIPPEYGHTVVATPRGDVYSFGVVLLEIVTGRRPIDVCGATGGARVLDLVSWLALLRSEGRIDLALDPVLVGSSDDESRRDLSGTHRSGMHIALSSKHNNVRSGRDSDPSGKLGHQSRTDQSDNAMCLLRLQMLQVLDVAFACTHPDPSKRPSIEDVVARLDKIGSDDPKLPT